MAQCCVCKEKIKGTVRTVKGTFWETWRAFCQQNHVKSYEDDLLDNSCYAWIRKYGAQELECGKMAAKKSIIAETVRVWQKTRPLYEDTVAMQPFEEMEVDYARVK